MVLSLCAYCLIGRSFKHFSDAQRITAARESYRPSSLRPAEPTARVKGAAFNSSGYDAWREERPDLWTAQANFVLYSPLPRPDAMRRTHKRK